MSGTPLRVRGIVMASKKAGIQDIPATPLLPLKSDCLVRTNILMVVLNDVEDARSTHFEGVDETEGADGLPLRFGTTSPDSHQQVTDCISNTWNVGCNQGLPLMPPPLPLDSSS